MEERQTGLTIQMRGRGFRFMGLWASDILPPKTVFEMPREAKENDIVLCNGVTMLLGLAHSATRRSR